MNHYAQITVVVLASIVVSACSNSVQEQSSSISIDAASPALPNTARIEAIDLTIEGGVTAVAVSLTPTPAKGPINFQKATVTVGSVQPRVLQFATPDPCNANNILPVGSYCTETIAGYADAYLEHGEQVVLRTALTAEESVPGTTVTVTITETGPAATASVVIV